MSDAAFEELAKAVAQNNEPEVLRLLEADPTKLDEVDYHGNTLLNSSCAIGASTTLILALIEAGADVSKPNKRGLVPLFSAVYSGAKPEVFRALVKAGADVNYQNDVGGTALQMACVLSLPYQSIATLVELGANVDLANEHGYTPLILACKHKLDAETVKLLVSKSKQVNAQVSLDDAKAPGFTALHFACKEKQPATAGVLIGAGANIHILDKTNKTASQYADVATRDAINSMDPVRALANTKPKGAAAAPSTAKTMPVVKPEGKRLSIWRTMNDANPVFSVMATGGVPGARGSVLGSKKPGGTGAGPASALSPKHASTKKKAPPAMPTVDEGALDYQNEERLAKARAARAAQREASGPPVKFPQHPMVPTINVFGQRGMGEPTRLLYTLENYLMTSSSIARAWSFRPTQGDVLVVAAPCSGQQIVQRVVRYLQSDKPLEVANDRKGHAPWIESRYMDADPSWLQKPQGSTRGRVFQTTMTYDVCHVHQNPEAKYIVVLRHPVDIRYAFYEYLKQCYEVPAENEMPRKFDDMFTCEDFAELAISLCDAGQLGGKPKTYEQFMLEWVLESNSNPGQTLLVFLEALLARPTREIKRIAAFLDIPVYEDLIGAILRDAAQFGLGTITVGGKPMQAQRTALRRMTMRQSRSMKGKSGAAAAHKSMPVAQVQPIKAGEGSKHYTKRSLLRMKLAWIVIAEKVKHAETYEDLYESLYGEPYPYRVKVEVTGWCGSTKAVENPAEQAAAAEAAVQAAQRPAPTQRAVSVKLHTGVKGQVIKEEDDEGEVNPAFAKGR